MSTEIVPASAEIVPADSVSEKALAVSNDIGKEALTDEMLSSVNGIEDVDAYLAQFGAEAEDFAEYGTGFVPVPDKMRLVGTRFVILAWRFGEGDHGGYVRAAIVDEYGKRWLLSDGGKGIYRQLRRVTRLRVQRGSAVSQVGLACKGGLSVSSYDYVDEAGRSIPTQTFYLSE